MGAPGLTVHLDGRCLFDGPVFSRGRDIHARDRRTGVPFGFRAPFGCLLTGTDIEDIRSAGSSSLRIGIIEVCLLTAVIAGDPEDETLILSAAGERFDAQIDGLVRILTPLHIARIRAALATLE